MTTDARASWYDIGGRLLDSARVTVEKGQVRELNGRLGTYLVKCNEGDDGGVLQIIEIAETVSRGGFFGLEGLLGPKSRTLIDGAGSRRIELRSPTEEERVTVRHIGPAPKKVRFR